MERPQRWGPVQNYFASDPLRSYLHEPQKNENFLSEGVERNSQTRWVINFLRRLFARFKSKFHK